ncbi:hypothetical protein VE01_00898 [Pseudogymnoascus verrucosus]|uniref:Uncharacterized protein n=1 Tax=Pseudogymnoascus verrucosus TaxID=342668 RepID=A0A2P2SW43_9PEZI|nr:uncharacterized protein VE01_00898 [Pseudogymnoascus verrucosus]OBU01067.1 hypothetical protein VE01_00898 [Pseudogymnoascus verrucosus]
MATETLLKQNAPVAKSMLLSATVARPRKKTKLRDLAVRAARDQPVHALVTALQLRTKPQPALHVHVVSAQLMLVHARKLRTEE